MGYYTSYSISFKGSEQDIENFKNELIDVSTDCDDVEELLDKGCVDAKLYNLVDWICSISENYPDLCIKLNGTGDDQDDMWEARWKGVNWEIQYAVIPPFENENLQFTTND